MDLADFCTDVVGGKLMLGANGRACDLEIEFDDQKNRGTASAHLPSTSDTIRTIQITARA